MLLHLPYDILHLITLDFPAYHLAINHKGEKIYSEQWFRDKLYKEYIFPLNVNQINSQWKPKLWVTTTYKRLYNKYRETVHIHKLHRGDMRGGRYIGNGIKATNNDRDSLLLTFNGDLFVRYFKGDNLALIDTEVIDIDSYTYIKQYEWYKLSLNCKPILIMKNPTKFKRVMYTGQKAIAITEDNINYEAYLGKNIKINQLELSLRDTASYCVYMNTIVGGNICSKFLQLDNTSKINMDGKLIIKDIMCMQNNIVVTHQLEVKLMYIYYYETCEYGPDLISPRLLTLDHVTSDKIPDTAIYNDHIYVLQNDILYIYVIHVDDGPRFWTTCDLDMKIKRLFGGVNELYVGI